MAGMLQLWLCTCPSIKPPSWSFTPAAKLSLSVLGTALSILLVSCYEVLVLRHKEEQGCLNPFCGSAIGLRTHRAARNCLSWPNCHLRAGFLCGLLGFGSLFWFFLSQFVVCQVLSKNAAYILTWGISSPQNPEEELLSFEMRNASVFALNLLKKSDLFCPPLCISKSIQHYRGAIRRVTEAGRAR